MSSSSNTGSNQTKFANSNLNNVFSKPAAAGAATAGGTAFNKFSGMLVLKRPTGGATRAAAGVKLSVPKPVNLPSIKKEHAGNDPSTQLIPANATGGWIKSEPEPVAPPPEVVARLTAGSTWATSKGPIPGGGPVVAWQPPPPTLPPPSQPIRGPSFPADRHLSLNPEEYPSLAATKTGAPPVVKLGPRAAYDPQQDDRAWADDERAPPGAHRADWAREGERPDEERFQERQDSRGGDARPQWDNRERSAGGSQYDSYPTRSTGGGSHDEQTDYNRNAPARGYPGGSYNSYDSAAGRSRADAPPPPPGGALRSRPNYEQQPYERYSDRHDGPPMPPRYGPYDPYEDRSLFPPAPPRGPPPSRNQGQYGEQRGQFPGGAPHHAAAQEEEDDPERQAFEAEVRRLAAELARKKRDANAEKREAIMEKRALASSTGVEGEEEESGEPKALGEESEAQKPDAASLAAKALAMTQRLAQREIDLQENERLRKAAASEKLRQLDEQIAARSAAAAAVQAAVQVAAQQLLAQQQAAQEEAAQIKAAAAAAAEAAAQKQALPAPVSTPTQLAAPPGLAQHPSAQHARPSSASQQQRQAPQQLQQLQHTQQPAATRPPAPAPHGWARPPAISETAAPAAAPAMFGSFDTGLLHEIRSAPPPPPATTEHRPAVKATAPDAPPKTWRPVEGPAPAPIAPSPAPVTQQRAEAPTQHNKERTAGLWNDAGARDSARDAADASIAEKRASQVAGRGRGARNEPGGRGGRGGRGSAPGPQAPLPSNTDGSAEATPPAPAAASDTPASAAPVLAATAGVETVRARNVRVNPPRNERIAGEERPQGLERGERSARGGRGEGRGRGGRGGRGGHEEGSDGQWAAPISAVAAVAESAATAPIAISAGSLASGATSAVEQAPRVSRERKEREPRASADMTLNQSSVGAEGRPASGQPAARRERDTREPRRGPPPGAAASAAATVVAPPMVVPFTMVVGALGESAPAAVSRGEVRPRGPARNGAVPERAPAAGIAAAAAAVAAAKAALPAKLPSSGGSSTSSSAPAPPSTHRISSAPPSSTPANAPLQSNASPVTHNVSPLPPAPTQAWGAIGSVAGSAGVLRPVANAVLSLNDPITSEPPVVVPHLPHSLAAPKYVAQQQQIASPHPIGPPSIFDRQVGPRVQSANQHQQSGLSHDVRPSAASMAAIAASEAAASKSAAMIAAAAAAVAVSALHEPNTLHLPMDLNPEVHLLAAANMLPKQQQTQDNSNIGQPRHHMQQQGTVSRPAYGFAPQQQVEQHGNGSSSLGEQQRQLLGLNNPWEPDAGSARHLVHLLPPQQQQQAQHMQVGEAAGSYYNPVQSFHPPPGALHAPPLSPSLLGNLHQPPVFQNSSVPASNFDLQGGSTNGHSGHPSDQLSQFSAGGPPSRPYTQGLNQFGSFNTPYSFTQQPAPFMPTNKMPDWSTTARLSTAAPIAGPPGLTGLNSAGLLHGSAPAEGFSAAGGTSLNLNAAFSGGHGSPNLQTQQQMLLSPSPNQQQLHQNQQHLQGGPMQGTGKASPNAPVPYSSQIQQQYQAHPPHLQQHQQQRAVSHTELPEDPFVAEPAKPPARPMHVQQQHNKGAAVGNHMSGGNAAPLPPPPPPGAIRGQQQHNSNMSGMQHQALGLKGGPPIVSGAMMHAANPTVGNLHAGGMMMDPLHGGPMMQQHQGQQQHMQTHNMQPMQMQHNGSSNINHFGSHQQHQGGQMLQQPMQHQQLQGGGNAPAQHSQPVRGNLAGRGPGGQRGISNTQNNLGGVRNAGANLNSIQAPLPEHNAQSAVYMGELNHSNHHSNQGGMLQQQGQQQLSGGRGTAPGPMSNGPAGRGGGRMAASRGNSGRGGGQQAESNHTGSVAPTQNTRPVTAPHHAPQAQVAMPTMGPQVMSGPGPQRQQQGPPAENGVARGRGPARSGSGAAQVLAPANGNAAAGTGPGPAAGGRGAGGRGQANRGPAPNTKGGAAPARPSGPTPASAV